mmetsp:Transcript_17663/g.26465  ORF Transcript_17663/g.26465 Transcript_17663/m.26465 type:complete len:86 (+) Transcript_17663:6988-7245(+)
MCCMYPYEILLCQEKASQSKDLNLLFVSIISKVFFCVPDRPTVVQNDDEGRDEEFFIYTWQLKNQSIRSVLTNMNIKYARAERMN